jgi:hypothetical protein
MNETNAVGAGPVPGTGYALRWVVVATDRGSALVPSGRRLLQRETAGRHKCR